MCQNYSKPKVGRFLSHGVISTKYNDRTEAPKLERSRGADHAPFKERIVIPRPGLAMVKPCTKFEVYNFIRRASGVKMGG